MKKITRILALLLALILSFSCLTACADVAYGFLDALGETLDEYGVEVITDEEYPIEILPQAPPEDETSVTEKGTYTSPDEVALYISLYGKLPSNYIPKDDARALGWDSSKGNLWDVAPGKSIGGDRFGNYEGLLPKASGRKYYECDVNYGGGYRGAERIVFSNDGLVYYTSDHYETFTLMYKEGVKQ